MANQEQMTQSLEDYNAMFGTHFTLATIKAYNTDLNDRIARKKDRFAYREEQLDLVIVVDRLLTGFDAPCLSTLFIDRKPMKPQHLIQAFSRTNRLFDGGKKFGQIVTFQTPDRFKTCVDEALSLYSNGGETAVLAPDWASEKDRFIEAVEVLLAIAASPDQVPDLDSATDMELKRFAKAFQAFDRLFASIQVYADYDEEAIMAEIGLSRELISDYTAHYKNIIEELRRRQDDSDDKEPLDFFYELESVHMDEINYHYILSLIQNLMEAQTTKISDREKELVDKYIQDLAQHNPKLSELIDRLWTDIQTDKTAHQGQSVTYLLDQMIDQTIADKVKEKAQHWQVGVDELQFVVDNFREGRDKQLGEKAMSDSQDYQAYKDAHGDAALNKLKYKKALKEDYQTMIREDILPLRGR